MQILVLHAAKRKICEVKILHTAKKWHTAAKKVGMQLKMLVYRSKNNFLYTNMLVPVYQKKNTASTRASCALTR